MAEKSTVSRRSFLKATGGTASAVALIGTAAGTDAAPYQEGNGGGTLNLISPTMTTLDPVKATDTASGRVIQQVFDALMNYPNGEVEVEPQLAESFETSEDFTT